MSERETLDRRLRAVERTLTGDEQDLDQLQEAGELAGRVEQVETELEAQQRQIEELEAATQALRGYVGNVRAVNSDVEQRADAAVAAVDRLEDQLDANEGDYRTSRAGRESPAADGGTRNQTGERGEFTASGRRDTPASCAVRDRHRDDGVAGEDGTGSDDIDDTDEGLLAGIRARL